MMNASNKIYPFFALLVVGSFLLQYPVFAASPGGTNNAEFVSQSVPALMTAGQNYDVSVTMKNIGTSNWTNIGNYKLGSQNPQDNTTWSPSSRVLLDANETVAPGQQKTFTFSVKAPSTPGTYNFQWRMVKEFVEWFGGSTSNMQVVVSVLPPQNNAAFISQSVPTSMIAGQSYTASVTIKNTGAKTWLKYPESGYYRIGSQSPPNNNLWGNIRFELPRNVAPGETATVPMNIITPTIPGTYDFQWRMVEELVEWFGDFTPKLSITINTATECVPKASISVKDCGAKGDGVNDDAPAIQKAINSVAPGGTVYIPAGTYMLGTSAGGVETFPDSSLIQSALIASKNNVTLKGDGNTTVLKLMPSKKMRAISVTASGVVVEKIAVDGNKAKRNGSVPWPGGDVVDALVYGSSQSSNVTVRFCEVRNGIEDGIGFWKSNDVYVHDCASHDNGTLQAGGAGISLSGGARGKAVNNNVYNNTAAGIWSAFGSNNVEVTNNTVRNNRSGGITIGGGIPDVGLSAGNKGFIIFGNTIEGNGSGGFAALTIFSSSDGAISNNTVINNAFDGIQFDDEGTIASTNWKVENNTCSNTSNLRNQDFGIRVLSLSKNITLRGNTCRDNGTSINHQIVVQNESAVNFDWRKVNIISYAPVSSFTSLPPQTFPPPTTQTAPPTTPPPSPTAPAKESKKQTEVTQSQVGPQPAVSQEAASQIIEKQKNEGKLDIDSVQAIELRQDSKEQPFYEVKAKKRVHLFFLIPISMSVTITVNADAGAVEKVQEPWWGFLAF